MRVLILGATGMLGSAVFNVLSEMNSLTVWGTLRNSKDLHYFPEHNRSHLLPHVDVLDLDNLLKICEQVRPDVVINCVGLIKQLSTAKDPLMVLPINSMLPHRLANICSLIKARFIHISTDCVFSGKKGNYTESDFSDAEDLYGKSKYIGEVVEAEHALTIRTSIIGHEINSKNALLEWFLAQSGTVKGYTKAIFSGLPTIELARVIGEYVLPNPKLSGLYHVVSEPIDKFSLLSLVAEIYNSPAQIMKDEEINIDRSLNGEAFQKISGYKAPSWNTLIKNMYSQRKNYEANHV